ncbi:MAG: hypothetical protein ACREC0_12165 [Methylocella sp.]
MPEAETVPNLTTQHSLSNPRFFLRDYMTMRPKLLDTWDEPQFDPLTTPPEDFEGMSLDDAADLIKHWFFENFENPAQITPYESAEGGYQYIWGGPYDARDVIENVFADTASEELITAAIAAVEHEGIEWVPNAIRIQPPDEEEDEPPRNPEDLHTEMMKRIAALEETLAQISPKPAGIGHNNPPEPIDAVPFSDLDLHEVANALIILKAQPFIPSEMAIPAVEVAGDKIKTGGEKILGWLTQQADSFFSEAVKEAGKEFGKWGMRTAIWALLAERLISVGQSVATWLQTVHPPF